MKHQVLTYMFAGAFVVGCGDVLGIPGDLQPSTTTTQNAGGVVLRDGRLATLPAQPATVGTLRLLDQSLERSAASSNEPQAPPERSCTADKALCVIGGFTAKGQSAP